MPDRFEPRLSPPEDVGGPTLWFVFQRYRILIDETQQQVPRADSLAELGLTPRRELYFGLRHTAAGVQHCVAVEVDDEVDPPPGTRFVNMRMLFFAPDALLFPLAGRAVQIVDWDRNHQFCGRCGHRTQTQSGERARKCPECDLTYYPRISPAIIVSVERHALDGRGSELLLAHNARFNRPFYSVLAGFVEPGESLEECVRREISEEVGLEVTNIRYFGSQPWPFPNSLMIAFQTDYAGGSITVDDEEIDDARWFAAGDLPSVPPSVSIARALIDDFVARNGRAPA